MDLTKVPTKVVTAIIIPRSGLLKATTTIKTTTEVIFSNSSSEILNFKSEKCCSKFFGVLCLSNSPTHKKCSLLGSRDNIKKNVRIYPMVGKSTIVNIQ